MKNNIKMKNIKQILIFAVLIASVKLFAQQDPSYSMYRYNMNIINPAYAGTAGYTEFNVNLRSQWVNLDKSPETQTLSFGKPLNDKIGLGLSIVNDKVDVTKETTYTVDFSYKLQLSETSDLFLGIKAGGYNFKADLQSKAPNDPAFGENVNKFNAVFGAGAYLKIKKFYAALSFPNLLNGKRVEANDYTNAVDKTHIFLGAGYEFDVNDDVKFSPSIMSRFVQGAPASIDLTAMFDIYNKVELGGSYRLDDSVSAIALIKMSNWMQLGYAYEFTTSDVSNYSDGTHEIMLRFNLEPNKKVEEIITE